MQYEKVFFQKTEFLVETVKKMYFKKAECLISTFKNGSLMNKLQKRTIYI